MKKLVLGVLIFGVIGNFIGCNILENPNTQVEEVLSGEEGDIPTAEGFEDGQDYKNYPDYFFLNDGDKYEYIYKESVSNKKYKVIAYREGENIQYLYEKDGVLQLNLMKLTKDALRLVYEGDAGSDDINAVFFDKESNIDILMFKGKQEKGLEFGEYKILDIEHDIYSMQKDILTNLDNVTVISKVDGEKVEEFYYLMPYGIINYKKMVNNQKKENLIEDYYIIEANKIN